MDRQELRRQLAPIIRRVRRSKYSGHHRRRPCKLPPAAVTEAEENLVELAAETDGVSVAYIVRAGAMAEARRRLRRAGLLPSL
jgi:hypothetical protein